MIPGLRLARVLVAAALTCPGATVFGWQPHHALSRLTPTRCSVCPLHARRASTEENDEEPPTSGMSRGRFLKQLAALPLVASGTVSSSTSSLAVTTSSTTASSSIMATKMVSSGSSLIAKSGSIVTGAAATTTTASSSSATTLEESISGFVAGGALTVTKTMVKYPLDTATVRLQMPGTTYSVGRIGELMNGCYTGVTTPLVSNIPAGGVFFAVKDATKTALKKSMPDLAPWQRTCLAVAAAQFPYWAVRNPSEVIKTRQQANIPGYTNVTALQAFQQVGTDATLANETALSAYYTGYWENILYAYPADVVKFLVYDRFAASVERLSPAEAALAGAYATAVAQFVTTPLDVVRNRAMAKDKKSSNLGEDTPKTSYLGTIAEIGRKEGVSGLLAGAIPRVGKAFLSGAIQFATYEETKKDLADLFAKRRLGK